MNVSLFLLVFACGLSLQGSLWAVPAQATSYYVNSATGNNSNTGLSSSAAWKTIQKAATTVTGGGHTIIVAAGTYNERVTFPNAGMSGSPIIFICETNRACIVDGGTRVSTGWKPSSGWPAGVFEIPASAFGFGSAAPQHATFNDQMITYVRYNVTPLIDYIQLPNGSQEWQGIEASCRNYSSVVRCHFQDNGNPNGKNLKLAPYQIGAFHFAGAAVGYYTIDGFTFKNAYHCVAIADKAHHVTLQNSTCTNGYWGVEVRFGAHDNLIQKNRFFLNWIYEDHGKPRYTGTGTGTIDPIQQNVFGALRDAMPITASISVQDAGDNNRFLYNTLDHTGAAGIYQWSTQYHADPAFTNRNSEFGYNTINNCQDYCFLIQDTDGGDLHYHHNSHKTYYNGSRIGRVMSGSGQDFYYYNNTFSNELGCKDCGRGGDLEFSAVNSVSAGIFPNGAKAYFYHSTFGSADSALLAYSSQNLKNMHFMNDVFSARKLWVLENPATMPALFSGNWVGGVEDVPGSDPSWWTAPNSRNPGKRLWSDAETAFVLPAGSTAIDLGLVLPSPARAAGSDTPGQTEAPYIGAAPDAGAKEFGVKSDPVTGSPARMIPRANITISVSSEETDSSPAFLKENALDGNPATFWHTNFTPSATTCTTAPYCWAILTLNQTYSTNKLIYWPAFASLAGGAAQNNGRIAEYHVYVTTDFPCSISSSWTEVATGTWDNNGDTKRAVWPPVPARCVKLESRSTGNGQNQYMHIGEVAVFEAAAPVADSPVADALTDFQTRCGAPGVSVCYGFDEAPVGASLTHMKDWQGTDVGQNIVPAADGVIRITRDTTYKVSGAGSLVLTTPPPPLPGDNVAGNFELNPAINRSIAGGDGVFGPHEDIYLQFWRRQDNETQFNTWRDYTPVPPAPPGGSGAGMKYFVLYHYNTPCEPLNLVLHTYYITDILNGYSNCGQVPWNTSSDLATWTSTTPYWLQQGVFDCRYTYFKNCYLEQPDVWTNYYCKFHVGSVPVPANPTVFDSTVECWYARQGETSYTKFLNITSGYFLKSNSGFGFNSLELMMYMTNVDVATGDPGVTSKVYYDELIISSQPIAFPGTATPIAPPAGPPVLGGKVAVGGRVSVN